VNVLLVPAHPGFLGQIPQSRKTVVCVCVIIVSNVLCTHQIPERIRGNLLIIKCCTHEHFNMCTHTHNRFTALLEYVRDHPGEQVPKR